MVSIYQSRFAWAMPLFAVKKKIERAGLLFESKVALGRPTVSPPIQVALGSDGRRNYGRRKYGRRVHSASSKSDPLIARGRQIKLHRFRLRRRCRHRWLAIWGARRSTEEGVQRCTVGMPDPVVNVHAAVIRSPFYEVNSTGCPPLSFFIFSD
jgi:hypothetical protein